MQRWDATPALPTFCRHNRFLQNCAICSREQAVELRQVVSPGGAANRSPARTTRAAKGPRRTGGVRVRQLARGADDGFHSPLTPGLKSSVDAERLAQELAFAQARLKRLADDPPGLYREVAVGSNVEERTWLAFQIAYLGPLDGEDPFSEVRARATSWSSGELPALDGARTGPRGAHDPAGGTRTLEAYRDWVGRAGSQAAAFTGEASWPAERRFARLYERLALPGLHRDARYELLLILGRLGVYELRPDALHFGGENVVTVAAKRVLGIGDPILLERRAAEFAAACELPIEALDGALFSWGRGERATEGLEPDAELDAGALDAARAALRL